MSKVSHGKRREKKYGKYAVHFNAWYLFAGLYLLGGKFIPGMKEVESASSETAFQKVNNYFSNFIKEKSLIDKIKHPDISDKYFIGAFEFFQSLFIPLVSSTKKSLPNIGFYDREEFEIRKLGLMTNHSSKWAERTLIDNFVDSTPNPLADQNFFNYMERLKSDYIIFGDTESRELYISIVEYITFKKLGSKKKNKWPSEKIFLQQSLFVNIENHPVSNDEMTDIVDLLDSDDSKKMDGQFNYFLQTYYSTYYYFFKCLNGYESNSVREILFQINSELSMKSPFAHSVTKRRNGNLRNGKALGCGPDSFPWSEIEADTI